MGVQLNTSHLTMNQVMPLFLLLSAILVLVDAKPTSYNGFKLSDFMKREANIEPYGASYYFGNSPGNADINGDFGSGGYLGSNFGRRRRETIGDHSDRLKRDAIGDAIFGGSFYYGDNPYNAGYNGYYGSGLLVNNFGRRKVYKPKSNYILDNWK